MHFYVNMTLGPKIWNVPVMSEMTYRIVRWSQMVALRGKYQVPIILQTGPLKLKS
jgi:hypothetical protein